MNRSFPNQTKKTLKGDSFLKDVLIYQAAGVALGTGVLPSPLITLGVFVILIVMISRITQKRLTEAIQMLLILQFLQPYLRSYARSLPYFYVELCTIIFVALYLREFTTQTVSELQVISTLITLYMILELVSYTQYSLWLYYRAAIGNTLSLTMLIYAGVKKTKVNIGINAIVQALLLGGSLLSGIILSAHLRGNIEYGSESNFEASNGMGPVQLSFYLALTSFLFFYKFYNESESKKKIFYVSQMLLVAGLSALTFSRGGLYFLTSYVLFYLFFNRQKLAKSNNSIYLSIVFVPMLYFAYTTILSMTGEKVVDRFQDEGTGNRDLLVDMGLQVFQENPAFGVGTSGFVEYVSQPRLWGSRTGAHNEFIRSLAEHGIIGGIIYFGFVITAFLGVGSRRLPMQDKSLYYIFMFSYVAGIIHNGQKIGLQCFMVFLAISPLTHSAFKSDVISTLKPRSIDRTSQSLIPKAK